MGIERENEGAVCVWDVRQAAFKRELKHGNTLIGGAALSPDGKLLATACRGGEAIRLWNPATGRRVRRAVALEQAPESAWSVAFSPDGCSLARISHESEEPDRSRGGKCL